MNMPIFVKIIFLSNEIIRTHFMQFALCQPSFQRQRGVVCVFVFCVMLNCVGSVQSLNANDVELLLQTNNWKQQIEPQHSKILHRLLLLLLLLLHTPPLFTILWKIVPCACWIQFSWAEFYMNQTQSRKISITNVLGDVGHLIESSIYSYIYCVCVLSVAKTTINFVFFCLLLIFAIAIRPRAHISYVIWQFRCMRFWWCGSPFLIGTTNDIHTYMCAACPNGKSDGWQKRVCSVCVFCAGCVRQHRFVSFCLLQFWSLMISLHFVI